MANSLNPQLSLLVVRLRVFSFVTGLVQAGCGHLSFAEAADSDTHRTYIDNKTPVKDTGVNHNRAVLGGMAPHEGQNRVQRRGK